MTDRSAVRRPSLPALFVCAALLSTPALAAKTDVVVLTNGDHLTGEIKQLRYGRLTFKTDNLGTVSIEWDKIASISTNQVLQLEMKDGGRYIGRSPAPGPAPGILRLTPASPAGGDGPTDVSMADVIRVDYLEQGQWLSRLEGAVSAGYAFTQASDVQQFNFAGNVGTRTTKRRWDLALDAQATGQASGPSSERASLVGTFERFLPNRYYYEGALQFTRNSELGLDLRSLVGGTFGRYLVQSRDREWRAGAGLAVSRELRSDGTSRDSLEAQLSTGWRLFRYDSPKRDVTTTLAMLPSLTERGRVRGEASIDVRYEIVKDLFFKISLYDSYDNKPTEGAPNNDWSTSTALELSF
jgi:hypothetical protein